jgi:hypothetical protein
MALRATKGDVRLPMREHALVSAGRVRSPRVAFSLFLPRVFNRAECRNS